MNVPTITMPPDDAKKKLKALGANLHRQVQSEYSSAIKAFRILKKGQALLDIAQVFRACEFDEKGIPRLAICRADAKEVCLERPGNSLLGTYKANDRSLYRRFGPTSKSLHVLVQFSRPGFQSWSYRYAPVPMIPADVIPAKGHRSEWHILWEVDHWSEKSQRALASRDPILLKHIQGSLYAVLAEWDLTPVEVAIMNGAIRA